MLAGGGAAGIVVCLQYACAVAVYAQPQRSLKEPGWI
jgi:hypothetical protein